MNVGSSTATTASNNATSATATSSVAKTQEKNNASFEEEMKNVDAENSQEQDVQQNSEAKPETKEETSDENETSDNKMLTSKIEMHAEVDSTLKTQELLTLNIQQLLDTQNQISNKTEAFDARIITKEDLTRNIGTTLTIESINMTENDAQFFVDVVKNNNAGVQNVVHDVQQAMVFGSEEVKQSANVSKTLINALANTQKTGQAVRIDFGNDIAVVMRVTKDGAIMANFIPGDKAVEEYLKNNIGFLKQRFEEEDIPYSRLSYSQHEGQERRERQQSSKEDKQHE